VLKLKQSLVENWVALEIASGMYLPQQQDAPPAGGQSP
jgi:hypothetical protein